MNDVHKPVLLQETIEHLVPTPGKIFLDCTLGAGGHARAILEKTGPDGILVGLDQDSQILEIARQNLAEFGPRLKLVQMNFEEIDRLPEVTGISNFDGMLFDLGVSSLQLDTAIRGFSFNHEGGLDMRMNTQAGITAEHIVNKYSESDLIDMFTRFADEYEAPRIVRAILAARKKAPIRTTFELKEIIQRAKRKRGYQRTHPATKVFQALRVAVNRELEVLEAGLSKSARLLKAGGRTCVISFHSIEDRIVKNFFRSNPDYQRLTKKPITASREEQKANRRARSAKLRVGEKIENSQEEEI